MMFQAGAGLRSAHFSYLEYRPKTCLSWFEIIAENFLNHYGLRREVLNQIRQDYDLSVHGVSLNIASYDELDLNYLNRLKEFIDIYQPLRVSDHICWTGFSHNTHDLLPIPFTKSMMNHIQGRIAQVQDFLGRFILLENVSSYLSFASNEMSEVDFLNELMERAGCKLLLDINNVYVNSKNHKFDANEFLGKINPSRVGQIHLAGFTDMGTHLFDTHSKAVHDPVWNLFSNFISRSPNIPFMVEWDDEIPEFSVLENEVQKAIKIYNSHWKPKEVNV